MASMILTLEDLATAVSTRVDDWYPAQGVRLLQSQRRPSPSAATARESRCCCR